MSKPAVNTGPLTNIVEILLQRAVQQPDQQAFTFLVDGETEERSLTYADLDRRARAISGWLRSVPAKGERVILLYPSGLEFVAALFGCLYGGVTAVTAYPLDPARLSRTLSRLQGIIHDAQPVVAFTTADSLRLIEELCLEHPDLNRVLWKATETIPDSLCADWRQDIINPDALAVLQYTSGSTAAPKGVMLSHRNILENERMIQETRGNSESSTFVAWIPLAHDWGLINSVFQPLYVGARSVLMTTEAFLQKPARWLRTISRYTDVTSGGPNFAYELCASKLTPDDCEGLDLTNWNQAGVAAGPVYPATLRQFANTFGPWGFRREAFYCGYGLAEATVLVSATERFHEPRVLSIESASLEQNEVVADPPEGSDVSYFVSCGKAPTGQKVVIVDPNTRTEALPGHVAEIWVSGSNVAQGYWDNLEETDNTFRACMSDTHEGPFLRTGDLGFIHNEELFVTGRLKDLIIIRGRNLHPQDIELTAERSHKSLRPGCAVAFSTQTANEERLAIVAELRNSHQANTEEIIRMIRRGVAETHGVIAHAVALVRAGSVPKTSSGKLQRQACRASYIAGVLDAVVINLMEDGGSVGGPGSGFVAPRTPTEERLVEI